MLSKNLVGLLLAGLAVAGCAAATSTGGSAGLGNGTTTTTTTTPTPTTGPGTAERVIAEADIIQIDGGRPYAMSKTGTLSVVDVSSPGRLPLLGQTVLPGEPR